MARARGLSRNQVPSNLYYFLPSEPSGPSPKFHAPTPSPSNLFFFSRLFPYFPPSSVSPFCTPIVVVVDSSLLRHDRSHPLNPSSKTTSRLFDTLNRIGYLPSLGSLHTSRIQFLSRRTLRAYPTGHLARPVITPDPSNSIQNKIQPTTKKKSIQLNQKKRKRLISPKQIRGGFSVTCGQSEKPPSTAFSPSLALDQVRLGLLSGTSTSG